MFSIETLLKGSQEVKGIITYLCKQENTESNQRFLGVVD